jgi:hypothetical protein
MRDRRSVAVSFKKRRSAVVSVGSVKGLLRLVLVLVCLMRAFACGDFTDSGPREIDEISFDPFPTTRVLGAGDLETLREAPDDGTLVFDPAPASLACRAIALPATLADVVATSKPLPVTVTP